jgi:Aconitase A
MPTYLELVKNGVVADIVSAGGIFRECFCGPCFGAGDPRPMASSASATPPAISPTAKAPSPARVKSPAWR